MEIAKNTVLLIVDVQKGLDESFWGKRNNPNAEDNIGKLLTIWRKTNRPVIHIQHLSLLPDSPLRAGYCGSELKTIVKPQNEEMLFQKNVNSAFIGTGLENYLKKQNYKSLVIVGLTTPHCVSTTTRMAANLGFQTFVVADATAAHEAIGYDGKKYTAEEIHQISLATLHKEFATVVDTKTMLRALN